MSTQIVKTQELYTWSKTLYTIPETKCNYFIEVMLWGTCAKINCVFKNAFSPERCSMNFPFICHVYISLVHTDLIGSNTVTMTSLH